MKWVYENRQKDKRHFKVNWDRFVRLNTSFSAEDRLSRNEGRFMIYIGCTFHEFVFAKFTI